MDVAAKAAAFDRVSDLMFMPERFALAVQKAGAYDAISQAVAGAGGARPGESFEAAVRRLAPPPRMNRFTSGR